MINQNQRPPSPPLAYGIDDEDNASAALLPQIPLKRSHYYTYLLFCLALLLLCSCSTAPSPSPQAASKNTTPIDQIHVSASPVSPTALARIDWMNYTYHNTCYSNTQPFHVHHGVAVNNGIHFTVYQPFYGDLTGDAQPEAVIPYQCSAADTAGKHVLVYSGTAAHPRLLADLPAQQTNGTIDNVSRISIAHGELQLVGAGYSAGTPRCCPDLLIQSSYHWNGRTFVLVQSRVSKR